MDIEEAIYILNEAVIEQPSIKSYEYIEAGQINQAIEVLLEELDKKEEKIRELNCLLCEQINLPNTKVVKNVLGKLRNAIFLEKQEEKN